MIKVRPIRQPAVYENSVIIYTDGACRNSGNKHGQGVNEADLSAYAYFMKYREREMLAGEAFFGKTNNQMEMTAVIKGLEAIKDSRFAIKVYSDSALIINCVNQKWWKKWQKNGWTKKGGLKNAELWKQMIEQIERFKFIEFIKVKGHSSNEYNNLVDKKCNEEMDKLGELNE